LVIKKMSHGMENNTGGFIGMNVENLYRNTVEKLGKRFLGLYRSACKDNIKVDLGGRCNLSRTG